jgi:hypothetical protein
VEALSGEAAHAPIEDGELLLFVTFGSELRHGD